MAKTDWLKKQIDTAGYLNPYQVPKLIWSLIQEHFEEKYRVEVTTSYPDKKVTKPSITWRIFSRVPGGGKDGQTNSKGMNFRKIEKRDEQGRVHTLYIQEQRVTYEFAVFAPSNEAVEEIAWDLELAILEVVGEMQTLVPGFHMVFQEQIGDSTLLWRRQDELNVRTLRFLAQVPVKRVNIETSLDTIIKNVGFGSVRNRKTVTRSTDSSSFYIPVAADQRVTNILLITLYDGNNLKPLVKDTDYKEKIDSNQVHYIEWLEHGISPAVGESFRVEYIYEPLVRDYYITENTSKGIR